MKAFEARQKSLKNQFEWIEKKIKKAIEKGESRIIVKKTALYEEVVDKLIDDGFDVLIVEDPANSFTVISMLVSEEGRSGSLELVDLAWEFNDFDDLNEEDGNEHEALSDVILDENEELEQA